MTAITNTALDASGDPLNNVPVLAQLRAHSAWLADRSGDVVESITTRSASDGTWTLDLTPTGDYEDAGAQYTVVEGNQVYNIYVPDGEGPYRLRDILVVDPTTEPALPGLVSPQSDNALRLLSDGLYVSVSDSGGQGTPGQPRFYGHGQPPLLPTAVSGDLYLDIDSGTFYQYS